MPAVWPGFHHLQAGSTQKMRLQDVQDLFRDLKEEEGVRFKMRDPWGDMLLAICRRADIDEEEQLRELARLMMQMIQDMACPDQSGRSISSSMSAQIWQENACPMQPKHDVGAHLKGEYVRVKFGDRIDNVGQRKELSVSLHRIACWAARGNPADDTPLATHSCGKKQCLRLDCLKWGDRSSRQKEAYKAGRGKRRKR